MTREEVNELAQRLAEYTKCWLARAAPNVRFALLVLDEETGRASMVADIPDSAVHELTGMIVERGRDSVTEKPK